MGDHIRIDWRTTDDVVQHAVERRDGSTRAMCGYTPDKPTRRHWGIPRCENCEHVVHLLVRVGAEPEEMT